MDIKITKKIQLLIMNLFFNSNKFGDLLYVDPTLEYDIDWITGRSLPEELTYYFERCEPCIYISSNKHYIVVFTKTGKIVRTSYMGAFVHCL